MKNPTRQKFNSYVSSLAILCGSPAEAMAFTATPAVQQKLYERASESVAFLGLINSGVLVTEKDGEKLGLSANQPIMGRTDTSGEGERSTTDPSSLDSDTYSCVHVDFDTHLKYAKLDEWAKFPDFELRIRNQLVKAFGQDLLRVGFNGTHKAATTNKTANPLLQDVAKGWLQKIRDARPAQVFNGLPGADVGDPETPVYFGTNADNEYKNLDAVVKNAMNELLPDWAQDAQYVAIVGRNLVDDKYLNYINKVQANSETKAAEELSREKKLGGVPAYTAPFFPANAILITTFDNLSIYVQEGSRRRTFVDNPKKSQYEDYQSENIDFVVEDYDFALLIENLEERNAA